MFRDYLAHIHCAHKHMPYAMELIKLLNSEPLWNTLQDLFSYYKETITKKPEKEELSKIASQMMKELSTVLSYKPEDREVDLVKLLKSYIAFTVENIGEVLEKVIRIKRLGVKLGEWDRNLLAVQKKLMEISREIYSGKVSDIMVDDLRGIRGTLSTLEKEIVVRLQEVEEKVKTSNIEMALLEEIKDFKSAVYLCEKTILKILSGVTKIKKTDILIELVGNILASVRHIIEILVILYA